MEPRDVERTLKKLGIRASKRLGQNFLIDEDVALRQVSIAGPLEDRSVLEIGPGLGILTAPLLEESRNLIAIEKDGRLGAYLRKRFPGLDLIVGDALRVEIPPFERVVSNLPYEISSPITFRLLDLGFQRGVLMYQKEFAERLVAREGEKGYSRLSVVISFRVDARIVETVPKEKFFPAPKVDSAIVDITPRSPPFRVKNERHFLKLVDVLFKHRRKMIGNSILLHWRSFFKTEDEAKLYLRRAEWFSERVEELSPAQIAGISDELVAKD
ncbi:MAG: 16S rRNA (adenine(1518)-N(6)/adenine(1519)-N(6))-dimethyltransferase RsmA [Thermoplasmata archaeon]